MTDSDVGEDWRIDELAHRSGTSVDTIRFYQREGLLAPGRRQGRASVFGSVHLHQLEVIRDLQAKHFSLGAIKAIASEGRLGLVEALFASGEQSFGFDQLVTESGLDAELVAELAGAGVLVSPDDHGRDGFDGFDRDLLQAVHGLLDLGMPRRLLVRLARLYADHFAAMRRDITAVFVGGGAIDLSDIEMDQFQERALGSIDQLMGFVETLLDYAHRRTVERITLEVMETVSEDEPVPESPSA